MPRSWVLQPPLCFYIYFPVKSLSGGSSCQLLLFHPHYKFPFPDSSIGKKQNFLLLFDPFQSLTERRLNFSCFLLIYMLSLNRGKVREAAYPQQYDIFSTAVTIASSWRLFSALKDCITQSYKGNNEHTELYKL